jgi:hypothetical protein
VTHQINNTDQASVSFNFSLFKVLSILCVATSHWPSAAKLPMWIPTSIGLVIFSFSSALFTTRIYGVDVDVQAFWRKKVERLAVRYWFLLACLSVLLLAEGKTVFHWHSLVHVFGLSGFLNLAGPSASALGAGLWFFTLLLLFYLAFPYLARLAAASRGNVAVPLLATLVFFCLNDFVVLPFSLWLTALGFILGVFAGMYGTRVPAWASLAVTLVALALLLMNNLVLGYRSANGVLVGVACIAANLWLMRARLPQWGVFRALAKLENCLLEIFIIHTYLFVHPTGIGALDFTITMTLVIVAAWVLNILGSKLVRRIFSKPQPQPGVAAPLKSLP